MATGEAGGDAIKLVRWSSLEDRVPAHAVASGLDLVVTRFDDDFSVLYGRCLHRGALMSDGRVEGRNLICGLHRWDYRLDSGVSEYANDEALRRFDAWVDDDFVWVRRQEVVDFLTEHPQPYARDEYLGLYADPHGTPEEPYNAHIRELATHGLSRSGHHGPASAMGVPLTELPRWDDLQLLTAQLSRRPLADDHPVDAATVIGPGVPAGTGMA